MGRRFSRACRLLAVAGFLLFALTSAWTTSRSLAAPVLPPTSNTDSPPVVSGVPEEGQTLTTTNGGWLGTQPTSFTYRWQRCTVPNLIINPGFETDTAGWQSSYGAAISRSSEQARSGSYSLKVVTPGLNQPPEGARYASLLNPDPAREYRSYAYVYYGRTDAPTVRLKSQLWGTDPTWPLAENTTDKQLHVGWNRVSIRFTPPAGTTRVDLYVETTHSKVAITFYIDDVWTNSCVFIAGATSSSYTVTAADAGWRLSSVVDTQNSAGAASFGGTQTDEAYDKWAVAPSYSGPVFGSDAEATAAEPSAPPPVTVTLPTWRNLYDWPNGHGYVGWHFRTSAPGGAYGQASNLGGNSGLWLWLTGGREYSPNYAEWTYTAPGTTRIASVALTFAYRNKLLAHHCIEVGLRTGNEGSELRSLNEHCKPVTPPDSQRQVSVSLVDPSSNPTSKQLFFQIKMPVCNNPAPTPCSKYIPSLDPLQNGGYARLLKVDMILVDDDDPVPAASGPFHDLDGLYIDGRQSYDLTVWAADAGAGITRLWSEVVGGQTLTSHDSPCDPTHHTEALDARICPAEDQFTAPVDTNPLPEGEIAFDARAIDPAGNVGVTAPWRIRIDRTPPTAATDLHVADYDAATRTTTLAWTPGVDPDLPSGIAGSGLNRFLYRISRDGGASWSDWVSTDAPDAEVEDTSLGDVLTVEIQSSDDVGNTSSPVRSSVTVFAAGTPPAYASATPDSETTPSLSPDDATRAEQLARNDSVVQSVVGSRTATAGGMTPWVSDSGAIVGARLELTWSDPVSAERDWPVIDFAADGSYTRSTVHYSASNVTSLLVGVDLTTNTVVSVEPSGDAVIAEGGLRSLAVAQATANNAGVPTDATSPTAKPEPGTNPEGQFTVAKGVNLRRITRFLLPQVGADSFWNWDFHRTSIPPYSTEALSTTDWPINLIFWNNADVETAKDLWNRGAANVPGGYLFATAQYGRVWDSGGQPAGHRAPGRAVWDGDRGSYSGVVCVGHKWHYRVYAPSPGVGGDDRIYNLSWGYYVIASSHQDHHDNWKKICKGDWYGGSEDAEHKVATAAPDHRIIFFSSFGPVLTPDPWVVEDATTGRHAEDTLPLLNRVAKPHWEKNRYYQNNGMATMIRVDHRLCDASFPPGQSTC